MTETDAPISTQSADLHPNPGDPVTVTGADPASDRLAAPPEPDQTRWLDGSGGHRLWAGAWYGRTGADRGTVVLSHGFGEYLGRYGHIVRALTAAGYTVVGADHRGHGRSAGDRFRIRRFGDFIPDLGLAVGWAREIAAQRGTADRAPFLFGHSMGGLIAAAYVLSLPDQAALSGLVLSSPALQLSPDLPGPALSVVGLLARLRPLTPVPRRGGGLSSDPEVARRWERDPLLNHGPTVIQMAHGIAATGRAVRKRLPEITLPLFLFYGEADTVVAPAGSRAAADGVGSTDLTVRAWPDLLHETFNEPTGDTVVGELVGWLDARTPVCD